MDLRASINLSIIWDTFFPNECLVCKEDLQYSKYEILCPICKAQLVVSDSHLTTNHLLKQRLREWFDFSEVYSKYRFPNGSKVQKLIHHFKYHNLKYIGFQEGMEFGELIKSRIVDNGVTFLVPIPLHWYKRFKRGFNQSHIIARGLSHSTGVPLLKGFLKRKKYTKSQTKLNRQNRLKNMNEAFSVNLDKLNGLTSKNLHFLLIDDVITSGITLGTAAHAIKQKCSHARVSACSLAYKDYD